MIANKSFHNLYDSQARAYQNFQGSQWLPWDYKLYRSTTYRFFAHFHPYVPRLISRLNDGGVAELQDSDTLYLPQPNPPAGQPLQPLLIIADSTRATLTANVTGTRPDGTAVPLTAGIGLTLADSTFITIPAGTPVLTPEGAAFSLAADGVVALPGNLPISVSSGIQWNIAGQDTVVLDGATVRLGAGGNAWLAADGTAVALPGGTVVTIRSGMPKPAFFANFFQRYGPDAQWVEQPYPVKDIDFTFDGAYSIYNWELFFHAPLLVAIHLSQNQKFQDAQTWFHYIFNPTDNSPGPTPERFWKVKPFQYTDVRMIEQTLVNLSTAQDPLLYQATVDSIKNWKQNPFQPFAVAKFRPASYMLKTVMAYLDNLIAWGDSLFRQYTIETVNEATQLYVMAANILGPKPQAIPKKGSTKPLTYNDLRGKLGDFGNTLVDMEVDIPFDIAPLPGPNINAPGTQILGSIGQTLYFCIPRNDKLLAYWDTVADRLFKIHNSLNLQGVFQRMPLYDPPIDPALLVRAAAAGLDVSSIVSGLNQPLPLVRFQVLIAKAAEICQEVKSLGGNILATMEKGDNESLTLLRSQHERAVLGLAEMVKYSQWQDAIKARQGLEQSLATVTQRYSYYQKLLGRTDAQITSSIPQLTGLEKGSLQNLNFAQADGASEPHLALDPISPDISKDATKVSDGEISTITNKEVAELQKLQAARDKQSSAADSDGLAGTLGFIPDISINLEPLGVGASTTLGGTYAAKFPQASARSDRADADGSTFEANKTSKLSTYTHREVDYTFQSNSAKAEITQIFKQIRGAQIREAIAEKEYLNHQAQMQHSQEIIDFLEGNPVSNGFQPKETTIGFYAWMKRELKAVHAKTFQLAFEVAKKAERALQNELGDPSLSFVQFSYLDGNEGLLAGEKLLFDIKAMEMAYHDLNQREYELTKHASLLQVDPLALMQLRATGTCTFTLPEELFDMDCPGHYFRRIKSVALTLPCVAGPYTSVNCTLTLEKSSIRTNIDNAEGYARKGSEDLRFNDYYGAVQSIVTSSAQSDSGLFETNLHDERYLPFEAMGVAGSQWRLTIPSNVRQFDFHTIADAVVHVRYTAREGGDLMKAAADQNLQQLINKGQTVGSVCLFSIRHEFPSEWVKFQSTAIGGATTPTAGLTLTLTPEHYPFWAQGIAGSAPLKDVQFLAEMPTGDKAVTINLYDKADKSGHTDAMSQNPVLGNLLSGKLARIAKPAAVTDATHAPLRLFFDNNSMDDLWLAITWAKN